jgi:hypothetical protein
MEKNLVYEQLRTIIITVLPLKSIGTSYKYWSTIASPLISSMEILLSTSTSEYHCTCKYKFNAILYDT